MRLALSLTHIDLQVSVPPVDEGFHYLKQRPVHSSRSTSQDVPAAANTQDPFGIPVDTNPYAILADEPAPPPAEDPAYTCTEKSEFR